MNAVTKPKQSNVVQVKLDTYRNVVDEAFGAVTQDGQEQENLTQMVISQVTQACYQNNDLQATADNILSHINNIKPQDHVEVMLVSQMIATHHAATRNFNRAAIRSDSSDLKRQELGNANLGLANKMTRTFTTQMEALNRYRGKGQQKMTIEHVNISDGGQAVIGNVASTKKVGA